MAIFLNRENINLIKKARELYEATGYTFSQTNNRYNGSFLKACRVYRKPEDKGKTEHTLYTLYNRSDLESLIKAIENQKDGN